MRPDSLEAPALLVHGGAGSIRRDLGRAHERVIRAALAEALRRGHALLRDGGSALDAVAAAVVVLEDCPAFNAGRGSVFTHDGRNAMDAAIMAGDTLAAGAVADVRDVRHPVLLARAVMEHSPHVMLVGRGAEAFARSRGMPSTAAEYFRTEARWQQWQAVRRGDAEAGDEADSHRGTVGAVALDLHGRLAAATSTGGMLDKRWDRVGDSPIIGAGTYANARCAMSGTGWGEYYIRTVAAHAVCMRVAEMGQGVAEAAAEVILRQIPALGGDGGAIVLGADGAFAMPFNTEGMFRGCVGADGTPRVAIHADESLGPAGP